jgi:hypothetical protein
VVVCVTSTIFASMWALLFFTSSTILISIFVMPDFLFLSASSGVIADELLFVILGLSRTDSIPGVDFM